MMPSGPVSTSRSAAIWDLVASDSPARKMSAREGSGQAAIVDGPGVMVIPFASVSVNVPDT